jgi:biopolymer transport protein ExbD
VSGSPHTGRRRRHVPYKTDKGPHAAGPQSNINVTPLVDVCLVLLIIFMVVTPMLGRGKDVKLPTLVEASEHKEGDQVFVSVSNDGVWINQDLYDTKGDFTEALAEEMKVATGKATAQNYDGPLLFLKGDVDTDWGRARVVLEWIKETKNSNVALVVEIAEE